MCQMACIAEKSVLRTLDMAGLIRGRSRKKRNLFHVRWRESRRRTAAAVVSPAAPVPKIIVQFAEFSPFGEGTLNLKTMQSKPH